MLPREIIINAGHKYRVPPQEEEEEETGLRQEKGLPVPASSRRESVGDMYDVCSTKN